MLGSGIIVGSVGVLVRPVAKGLNSSISKAFAGSTGAARKAGQQAGKAFADPVAAEGGKLPGRALGPLRSRAASEAGTAGASAGTSFMSRVVSGIGSAAGTVASTLGRVLKGGAVVGGTAAIAGLGYTLTKGFGRLSSIENAESKLKGLGNSAEDVESIMNNALASVKGTSYGMDEAATTAASAVAAGIKPGQELEKYLGLVGDAAAIAGTDMASMGSIFNKVATSGKVQGDVFAQLGDQGIPIVQLLAEEMGVTAEEVYKLGADGEISSEMFLKAMSSMEGAALEAGNTTTGALKNAGAAISRLGATLLGGFYPMIGQIARRFTELVDVVEAKVGPILAALMESFGGSATAGIDGFFDTLIGWVEAFDPEPMIAFFGRVADIAGTVFTELTGGIRAFGAAWQANDGDITSSGFPGFMERAAYMVRQLWEAVKGLDFSSLSGFMSSLGGLGSIDLSGVGGAFSSVGGSLLQIASASPALLAAGLELLGSAMGFLAEHADTIVKLIPLIAAGFVAMRVHAGATQNALIAQRTATAAMAPVMLANNALILTNNLLERQAARAKATSTAATNTQTAATTRATVAERARTIATKIGAAASKAAAVATRLLGAAIRFATGPIGLIITGITLLVGALVLFFTKTETGKAIWQAVWTAIKNAAAAVVDWFMTTALPFLQSAWNGIAAGALWLYHSAILPAWNGIRAAIGAVANWITGTLWPAVQTAWNAIGAAAMWLWQNVITPAWNGIKLAIAVVVTAVLLYIDLMKFYFQNVIAPVALWLWHNVITPAWNGIKAAIGAVAGWIVNVAWPLIKSAWDAIAAATMWLWNNVLKPAWAGIQAAISAVVSWLVATAWPIIQQVIDWIGRYFAALKTTIGMYWSAIQWAISTVVSWFQTVAWPLIRTVIDWIKAGFNLMRDGIKAAWDFVKTRVIDVWIGWFRDIIWPAISRVIESIKSGFNTMRDGIKAAWDFVKDRAIKPIADWLSGTLKPKIDEITGNIKDAFDTMREGIKKAWDGIKEAAKTPIRFVIEDVYMATLRETFNGVADKLSLPDKWRLPARYVKFADGGVMPGYTPGRDVHRFVSPTGGVLDLSGGEPILRPEVGRVLGHGWVHGVNAAARTSGIAGVRSFLGHGHQAFKDGGVWGAIKGIGGDAWDWLTDKASTIAEAITDPLGVLTKLAGKAADLIPGGGMFQAMTKQVVVNAGQGIGDWLKGQLEPVSTDEGPAPAVAGRAGGSLALAGQLARANGLSFTSGYRPGARTKRTGSVSYHALGRAHDYAAPMTRDGKRRMMAFFNAMHPYKPTELLYSPAGNRQWRRWGAQAQTSGSTYRGHLNHVHVAFKKGGVYGEPTLFDRGGILPPGLTGVLNASGKPEAVLTNEQLKQLRVIASRPAEQAGDTFIGHGYTPEQLARAWRVEEKKKEALYAH